MNYLNLHVLVTLSAANPNRDDAGSPKSISYGGVLRSRISSQAMTRPKRLAFEAGSSGEKTTRSKFMSRKLEEIIESILIENDIDYTPELKAKALKEAKTEIGKLTKKEQEADKKSDTADTSKDTLIWLAEPEIKDAALKIAQKIINNTNDSIKPEDYLIAKKTNSLAIAAFGRMFAMRPDLQTEAAIQRSHAFTTHAMAPEVDYFTAVDDLEPLGAGHLGAAELTGGSYYWHANIDVQSLKKTWLGFNDEDAKTKLEQLFLALFTALPEGKQNTSAHHSLPSFVMASSSKAPVSLQTAFEKSVTPKRSGGGFMEPSIEALLEEERKVKQFMPSQHGDASYASLNEVPSQDAASLNRQESLEALATWCAEEVLKEAN